MIALSERRPTWWQALNSYTAPKATNWELELRHLGLTEPEAVVALHCRTVRDLETWIRTHYRTVYVPESALLAIGLHDSFFD